MKWGLLPLVLDIEFKALPAAEAADCLDRVNLLRVLPVLDLHKGIVQWCPVLLVTKVQVDSSLKQELLSLEGSISSGT